MKARWQISLTVNGQVAVALAQLPPGPQGPAGTSCLRVHRPKRATRRGLSSSPGTRTPAAEKAQFSGQL